MSKWAPLKTSPRRVREIILRVIGVVLKSQSITFIRQILLSLFIVITNETDGHDLVTGDDTPCEQHKKIIIQVVIIDFVEIEYLLGFVEMEIDESISAEYECQNNEFEYHDNPFRLWAEDIYKQSKCYIREGSGLNAMFLPSVVTCIIKCLRLLPLWSAIMVPFFGYGETTTSSAAVESSFKKLKNVTFKHMTLPVDIEEFLEYHISSLQGASLFRSISYNNQSTAGSPTQEIQNNNQTEVIESEDAIILTLQNIFQLIDNCPLCETGNLPVENGAHKCVICDTPVHALPSCSSHELGKEDRRICRKCFTKTTNTNLKNEDVVSESWNRKSKRQKTNKSYLMSNPLLRHLNLYKSKNIKSFPVLNNGSRADELKSCTISEIGNVVLTNTCAFDTLVSSFTTAYCDSLKYKKHIDTAIENDYIFFSFHIKYN